MLPPLLLLASEQLAVKIFVCLSLSLASFVVTFQLG